MNGCNWDGEQIVGTLTAHNANGAQRMPDKDNFMCVIVLNDQGGSVMNWNDEGKVDTLRAQTHGHEPIVVVGGVQKTTGCLMASGYSKLGIQEAMNGMYIVEKI